MGREDLSLGRRQVGHARRRDIESIDSELRSVAAVRRATQEMGEPLPLIDVVDALLDERLRARRVGYNPRVLSIPQWKVGVNRCRFRHHLDEHAGTHGMPRAFAAQRHDRNPIAVMPRWLERMHLDPLENGYSPRSGFVRGGVAVPVRLLYATRAAAAALAGPGVDAAIAGLEASLVCLLDEAAEGHE